MVDASSRPQGQSPDKQAGYTKATFSCHQYNNYLAKRDKTIHGTTNWVRLSLSSPAMAAFSESQAGRLVHYPFRGLLSVHYSLQPTGSPSHLMTLYIRGFGRFVTSTAAPIATGWSDRYRLGISPCEKTAFHGALRNSG
jgi:hypothetical protein